MSWLGALPGFGFKHRGDRVSHSVGSRTFLDRGLSTDPVTWGCPLRGEEVKQVEAKGFGQRSGQQVALFEVPEWTRAWLGANPRRVPEWTRD